MSGLDLVLASTSPRRRMVLQMLGIDPRLVEPGPAERPYAPPQPAGQYALEQALSKLRSSAGAGARAVRVAADTVVVLDGRVLGKPEDAGEARAMLRSLSGRVHDVVTGIAVAWRGAEQSAFERTRVTFRSLEEREIAAYVRDGEPLDKAGAYGIQGRGAALVRRVDGCFFNVVGLPVALLLDLLSDLGLSYEFDAGIVERPPSG